jgi:hypothetical protein
MANQFDLRRGPTLSYASGPQAVKAADEARRIQEARDLWPFPWVYPPPASERRNPTGYIVMPAETLVSANTPTLVLQYKVPSGFQFELTDIMFAAVTTNMQLLGNPGDVLYTVNRNTPASGFAPQGSPLADFQLVPFPFGSPTHGPIQLRHSENFQPTDIISVYATNVGATAGPPNYIVAMLAGWQRKA